MINETRSSGMVWLHRLVGFVFIFFIVTSAAAAVKTRACSHPDERAHLNGFLFFEGRWWPPDVNTGGIYYSPYGNSRVYSLEIVYPLFANLVYFARQVVPGLTQPDLHNFHSVCAIRSNWMLYRFMNVALFALTLGMIWWKARQRPSLLLFGLVLVILPQSVYIFSYVNSDAWGLALSTWLTIYVLSPPTDLFKKRRAAVVIGALTGLIIVSKPTFWFILPFCCSVLLYLAWRAWRTNAVSPYRLGVWAGIALLPVLLTALPYRVVYPLSQGDFSARLEMMQEERAVDALKPSQPLIPSYLMHSQGYPFWDVARNPNWWNTTLKSGYGFFGYMNAPAPPVVYWIAGILTTLWLALAGSVIVQKYHALPPLDRWLVWMAPATLGMVIFASLYNSWMTDYQPQGRYLFAALPPLAFVLQKGHQLSGRWLKFVLGAFCVVSLGLSGFVLWAVLIIQP